jgi:spore maturation protein CgeB
MVAPYDHLFFKEPYLVDILSSRTRLPVHFLAEACNPDRHRTEEPKSAEERNRYACDVVVAGNLYPYRLLVLEELPDEIDLKVYGNPRRGVPPGFERIGAAHTGTFVSGRTKALAFRGGKIVLNTMHYAELQGVNARLFEATGCGGFVLSHASPGLGRYFEDGRELATFNGARELRDRVRYYLDHEDERASIAAAGQARAHRDHTYRVRLEELVQVVGISAHSSMGALATCVS